MELKHTLQRCLVLAGTVALLTGCGGGSGDDEDATPLPDAIDDTTPEMVEEVCTPDCTDKDCGDDGCGAECGTCTDPQTCSAAGMCEDPVVPVDMCTNAEDMAVIAADPDAPLAITGDCVVNLCLANPTIECVVDCVQNGSDKTDPPIVGIDLSGGCAACYGASSLCGVDKCLAECIADTSAPECGECLEANCLVDFYACSGLPQGCDLPDAWDVATAVDSVMIPADGAMCPDFSGDSQGDNGLAAAGAALNGMLADMGIGYDTVLFEFVGVTDFADTAAFALNGLAGMSDGTDYLVTPLSYDGECQSLIHFADAAIAGGMLTAGPRDFTLSIPVQGDTVEFALTQGSITGTVAAGVTITDGIIAGVLGKTEAEVAVAQLKAICAATPTIDWCTYVPIVETALPLVFDLDLDDDGTMDAVSMCLQFGASAATIAGLQP